MSKISYKNIVTHYENCLDEHGDNHKGVDWPNEGDVKKRYDVMLDLIPQSKKTSKISLLDFGCGAAHLYQHIIENNELRNVITYSGSDLSEKFITLCQEKYPENNFYCFDLLESGVDNIPMFDYIILNGVFTEKRELEFEQMWSYFQLMIKKIFKLSNHGIAFNVMSKAVDWERDDLFHLSTDQLINFLTKEVSRNFVIRNDYGLYEYTVYLYK
jgi:SAM-dependent methyltransferase